MATLCATSKSKERQANQTVLCFSRLSHSVRVFFSSLFFFLWISALLQAASPSGRIKTLMQSQQSAAAVLLKPGREKKSHSRAAALPFISDSSISVVEPLSRRISHEHSQARAVTINAFYLEFFIWVKQTGSDDKSGRFYDFMKQN